MLERTSGLHKLMSIVHRKNMKFESKDFGKRSLRIKAGTVQRNQSVRNDPLHLRK